MPRGFCYECRTTLFYEQLNNNAYNKITDCYYVKQLWSGNTVTYHPVCTKCYTTKVDKVTKFFKEATLSEVFNTQEDIDEKELQIRNLQKELKKLRETYKPLISLEESKQDKEINPCPLRCDVGFCKNSPCVLQIILISVLLLI